ncbi:MAG: PTS transporter subunit IIC [Halanaerobiaceae bacterium]
MSGLSNIIEYIFSFEPYVVLPLIIFVMSIVFHIPVSQALKASVTIGIGFIGIFIVLGFFVENIGPAVEALTANTGLQYNVLDVGWPPLAAISWSFNLAPVLIVLIILVNVIMLAIKKTKTVNVDIWNYWHLIFLGRMVYETTESVWQSIAAALILNIIILKLADWSAKRVNEFTGLTGISITTLSSIVYYPFAIVGNKFIDRIKFINHIDADPEYLKKKLGLFGEPMIIGFIVGILLGIGAGYNIREVLELSFSISAVIYILPMMAGVLGDGLMRVSDGMKKFIKKKYPDKEEIFIGLDLAILLSNPSIIVTGLLLIPAALILAFILPGINFLPLGDLANIMVAVSMILVAVRGNILRSFLIAIPILAGKLIIASKLANLYTGMAVEDGLKFEGYNGLITGFLDGGNLIRYWIFEMFNMKLLAFIILPIIMYLFWYTKKESRISNF